MINLISYQLRTVPAWLFLLRPAEIPSNYFAQPHTTIQSNEQWKFVSRSVVDQAKFTIDNVPHWRWIIGAVVLKQIAKNGKRRRCLSDCKIIPPARRATRCARRSVIVRTIVINRVNKPETNNWKIDTALSFTYGSSVSTLKISQNSTSPSVF